MKPAQLDLNITRGDDYVLPLTVRGRDTFGNKTTLNLTGFTPEAKLIYPDGSLVIITANWLSQTTGSLELFIARTVTVNIPTAPSPGTKWYFALTDPANRKTSYVDGSVYMRDRGGRPR